MVAASFAAKAYAAGGNWAVFAPDMAFDSASTRLSKILGLEAGSSLYIFRPGAVEPRRIVVDGVWTIQGVSVSPATGLIGVNAVLRPRTTARYAVFVVDTTGRRLRRFDKARLSKWSPDGSKLTLWYTTERGEEYPRPDSVGVWEAASNYLQVFHVHPYDIGWWTNDLVLLDTGRGTDALDLRHGLVRRTSIRGQMASPDTLFSLSDRYEVGAQAWDERTRTEMTSRIEDLLEGGDLRGFPDPFWIRGSRHLLCVSACLYRNSAVPPFTCNVYVIDPKAGVVVQKIPGKGIGPTADRRGIVTLRGKTIRFVRLAQD